MSDADLGFFAGCIFTGVIAFIIVSIIIKCNTCEYEQKAIEAGAAYYDSKTAEFKWGKP